MSRIEPLDGRWLGAHPLPPHDGETDKNSRGRVLLAGGSTHVPGALRLTGEAALRAGAGKLQMATVKDAALALGMMVPEAATIALPSTRDGEISGRAAAVLRDAMDRCDTFVLGPGMADCEAAAAIVRALLHTPREGLSILLDAAAIACANDCRALLGSHGGRLVLTPHHGEMAHLTGRPIEEFAGDPAGAALEVARSCGGIVALKAGETVIAAPDGTLLGYGGGGVGLATGGSGDVLAGIIAGLMARGATPLIATAWGVWLHGEAGRQVARKVGPIGFLARELLAEIPGLMDRR